MYFISSAATSRSLCTAPAGIHQYCELSIVPSGAHYLPLTEWWRSSSSSSSTPKAVTLALEVSYTPSPGHFPGNISNLFQYRDRHPTPEQDWWESKPGVRREGPCTTKEDRLGSQDGSYMSQQERPPRPILSKTNPTTSPAQSSNATAPGPSDVTSDYSRPGQSDGASAGPPQTRLQTRSPPAESTPSRALGVHSILNPSQPASDEARNPVSQNRSVLPALSPRVSISAAPPVPQAFSSPRGRKRPDPSIQSNDPPIVGQSRSGRRVLTPVSPRVRGASRSNPAAHQSGTASGSLPPVGDGRHFYTAEPGNSHDSDIPPLPIPSLAARGSASYHSGPEPASDSNRMPASTYGYALGPIAAISRPSESPQTSQSSYSNVSQTSPQYGYRAPHVSQSPYAHQQAPHSSFPPGSHASGVSEAHYTMAQGQTYSMHLPTEHGTMTVPVEMDVQQASKVADEKRKRNAGASARFRQRRKEKENQASVTIASLEKDIKALEEERDFYFDERNFWRDHFTRVVGGSGQLPTRPRSPAPRRSSIPISSEGGSVQSQEQGHPETQSTRTQRRRTGDYPPSFASGPPSVSPMLPPQPPGQQQPYLGQGGGTLPPMQSPYGEARHVPPGQLPPPLNLPAVSRSQSYENLRPNNPYNRSWNPGR